jgi:hypothetical protein
MTGVALGASLLLNVFLIYREARRAYFRAKFKKRRPQQRSGGQRAA